MVSQHTEGQVLFDRINGLVATIKHFQNDSRGTIAMTFGLMATVMFLTMGAAVDYGRWIHARDQTRKAIDAAVLAAGRALQVNPGAIDAALQVANRFYLENTKSRGELVHDTIQFVTVDNDTAVTATGEASIATTILGLANIDELPLFTAAGSDFSKAVIATGGNSGVNLEISLMLDTSGSMNSNNKMEDMQAAAADLVNIVVWADQSEFTSKIALAPFSGDIRVPDAYLTAVRGSGPFNPVSYSYKCGKKTCTATYSATPCVVERMGAEKYTDAAPGVGAYLTAERTANGACTQPAANTILPLSNNKTAIVEHINGLQFGSGTSGQLGTAWAWYTLSPSWSSVWPDSAAADYGLATTKKIAILMTDGEYNAQYDANGVRTTWSGAGPAANGSSNTQARALCDGMKAEGIEVYTVGFDLGGNQTAISTLQYCATDPNKFYNAEDGDQLKQSFRDIALKLSALYLAN